MFENSLPCMCASFLTLSLFLQFKRTSAFFEILMNPHLCYFIYAHHEINSVQGLCIHKETTNNEVLFHIPHSEDIAIYVDNRILKNILFLFTASANIRVSWWKTLFRYRISFILLWYEIKSLSIIIRFTNR